MITDDFQHTHSAMGIMIETKEVGVSDTPPPPRDTHVYISQKLNRMKGDFCRCRDRAMEFLASSAMALGAMLERLRGQSCELNSGGLMRALLHAYAGIATSPESFAAVIGQMGGEPHHPLLQVCCCGVTRVTQAQGVSVSPGPACQRFSWVGVGDQKEELTSSQPHQADWMDTTCVKGHKGNTTSK